jgi:hypothetical protein
MRKFLQEGMQAYPAALVALSEYRQQVRSRLQAVLEEFSIQLAELGLSIADQRPAGPKLDDTNLSESGSWIGLRKNHGASLETGCHVEWDLEKQKEKQLWAGVWVYVGARPARDRLFSALQKCHSTSSKTDLTQYPDGSPYLSVYCDPDSFDNFDENFRALLEEWVQILSAAGGIRPFLSPAAASRLHDGATNEES